MLFYHTYVSLPYVKRCLLEKLKSFFFHVAQQSYVTFLKLSFIHPLEVFTLVLLDERVRPDTHVLKILRVRLTVKAVWA